MPGNGKPPDWIPPGQRPDPEDEWEVDGDGMLWDAIGLSEASDGTPIASMRQGSITKSTFGFYRVQWEVPVDVYTIMPALSPTLAYRATSQDGSAMQVQVESDTSPSFTAPVTTTYTSVTSGVQTAATGLGPYSNLSTRYFRVRAGDGTNWSEWVAGRTIKFDTSVGNGWFTAYENVGAGAGTAVMPVVRDVWVQGYLNVGIQYLPVLDPYFTVYLDADATVPTPHIWYLQPVSGRQGDGFAIIGHGFGSTQGTYTGHIEVDLGLGAGWQTVGVVTWSQVAASVDMYGPLRTITETKIDPEHGVIEILVPAGALPPGLQVRVVTDA